MYSQSVVTKDFYISRKGLQIDEQLSNLYMYVYSMGIMWDYPIRISEMKSSTFKFPALRALRGSSCLGVGTGSSHSTKVLILNIDSGKRGAGGHFHNI